MSFVMRLDRSYSGLRSLALAAVSDTLPAESQAALRQFSLERLMAYGVHHADAMELRGRVTHGETWLNAATSIADTILQPPEDARIAASDSTRINRLRRASALVRVSQLMMLGDDAPREAIQRRSADLYAQAAALSGDRERFVIPGATGAMAGWLFAPRSLATIGSAIVIGGIEGWAMDFDSLGQSLAARGIQALMLDGPGQGDTRLLNHLYFGPSWMADYGKAIDAVLARQPGKPLAFIGNSMGGSLAIHLARHDRRIAACCSNGGFKSPGVPWQDSSFNRKMAAHCGSVPMDQARSIWQGVRTIDPEFPLLCPLLIVHGGLDPILSSQDVGDIFEAAETADKILAVFSDGDHCVYNHSDDKLALIADWTAAKLSC